MGGTGHDLLKVIGRVGVVIQPALIQTFGDLYALKGFYAKAQYQDISQSENSTGTLIVPFGA